MSKKQMIDGAGRSSRRKIIEAGRAIAGGCGRRSVQEPPCQNPRPARLQRIPSLHAGIPDCREISGSSSRGRRARQTAANSSENVFFSPPYFVFAPSVKCCPIPNYVFFFFRLPGKSQTSLWILQNSLQSMSLQRLPRSK